MLAWIKIEFSFGIYNVPGPYVVPNNIEQQYVLNYNHSHGYIWNQPFIGASVIADGALGAYYTFEQQYQGVTNLIENFIGMSDYGVQIYHYDSNFNVLSTDYLLTYQTVVEINTNPYFLPTNQFEGSISYSWSDIDLNYTLTASKFKWVHWDIINGSQSSVIFTINSDFVVFDGIDPASYSPPFDNALSGDDVVTLPSTAAGIATWGLQNGFYGGDGNDTITAGAAGMAIYGDAGDDTIVISDINIASRSVTSSTDIYDGGAGSDTADFSQATSGVDAVLIDNSAQASTGLNFTNVEHFIGSSAFDTLTVSGGTTENNGFQITFRDQSGQRLLFDQTKISFSHDSGSGIPALIEVNAIDKLIFADGINNIVDLNAASQGSIALEMLRLADEVNGPQDTLSHKAEALAYATVSAGYSPSTSESISNYATASGRNWHAVAALELGMKPSDEGLTPTNNILYSFSNGVYQAISNADLGTQLASLLQDQPEANALVLSGIVNGQKTLAISFRGTDQRVDLQDYPDFSTHYQKYQPLIDAIKTYLADNSDITQLLVSGHSLGAAMAEYFSADFSTWDATPGNTLQTYTMGSPGSEALGPASASTNFMNTQDLVPRLGHISTDADARDFATIMAMFAYTGYKAGGDLLDGIRGNPFALAKGIINGTQAAIDAQNFANSILPKPLEGSQVLIDSDVSMYLGLSEHGGNLYIDELSKLLDFANDPNSMFSRDPLATSLLQNSAYQGPAIQIALGQPLGYASNLPRTNYPGRYTSAFDTSIYAYRDDNYVLGNKNADDDIIISGTDYVAGHSDRLFDGSSGKDRLLLLLPQADFTIDAADSNGGIKVHFNGDASLSAGLVGTAYNIELAVFRDQLLSFDGFSLTVDRPVPIGSVAAARSLNALSNGAPATSQISPAVFALTPGYDYADAGDGDMHVIGTATSDIIYTATGSKIVDGGDGNDIIIIRNGTANDQNVLYGGNGNDIVVGANGNDILSGDGGYDQIFGDTGNDTIAALGDGDVIDGGSGVDAVDYGGLARGYGVSAAGGVAQVALDRLSAVEDIHFRDATLSFDVNSDAAFIMRMYDSVLSREPDAAGFDYWNDFISNGGARVQMAAAFLGSVEFAPSAGLNDSDFVEFLYTQTLGRGSDPGGKAYWVGVLGSGTARADILVGFSESVEHQALTQGTLDKGLWTTDQDFQDATLLYDAFANRLPDQGGLLYWAGQLENGATLHDVAAAFTYSPEFQGNIAGFTNAQIVDFMYMNTLDRSADPGGQQYWVNAMNNGLSTTDLLMNFAFSPEHTSNMQPYLYQGVEYV